MKSIVQQVQALTSTVRQLQGDLDSLKGNGIHMRPDHIRLGSNRVTLSRLELDRKMPRYYPSNTAMMLGADPADAEPFDIASMGNYMKNVAGPITNRETQILNYIADGTTNKQIAYILKISEQTIKNHVSAILRKLHANDRAHAVALAIRNGWLSTERKHEGMVPVSSGSKI